MSVLSPFLCRSMIFASFFDELSSVKLLLSLIKTQFVLALKQGRRLLCCVHCDTCGLYPSQKIVQLGRNQDWFVIVFSGGVVYRQIRCDHFGLCLRMLYGR